MCIRDRVKGGAGADEGEGVSYGGTPGYDIGLPAPDGAGRVRIDKEQSMWRDMYPVLFLQKIPGTL